MATDLQTGVRSEGVALVTGGSRGIGREATLLLAGAGYTVIAVARASGDLDRLRSQLGAGHHTIPADLATQEGVEGVVETVSKLCGAPDVIINNAGAFRIAPFSQLDLAAFQTSIALNMVTPFVIVRAFLGEMLERGSGHIVTVGSIADRVILPENAGYASTKYGLRAMHEVLRLETRGSGVRATLVSPGPVDTRLWDPIDPDHREGFTPRESMLDPRSVADAIMYAITRPAHVDVEELRLGRS